MDFKSLLSKLDNISSKQPLNEGWDDMMKAASEKEKEKGTGKFDKKQTGTGTVYTRKSDTFDDGGDDSDTKKAKEKAKKAKVKEAEEKIDEDDIEEGPEVFKLKADAARRAGEKEFKGPDGKMHPVRESKKPDDDGDGVPDWADKKPGKDDHDDEKADDKDDDKKDKKSDKKDKDEDKKIDESLEECYDQAMQHQESGMNISSNMDTKTGEKSLTISARGDAAEELAQILKLSGLAGTPKVDGHSEVSMEESDYANVPDTQMQGMETQFRQGNDLNRSKGTYPKVAGADNPMQRTIAAMEAKANADLKLLEKSLIEQLNSLKVVSKKK